ncbi:MAG: HAD-IC family P-type ATPase, partial [Enterococcus aquimarinus]
MSMIVKKDHSCQDHHDHDHEHHHQHTEAASSCSHHHHHGKQPVILYVVGLVLYFIALLSPLPESLSNLLMLSAMVVAGYQVIFEGIGETITESIRLKKFWPNVHILMTLAAIGAVFLGDYDEGALLILIFSGAHFLEEYAEGRSKREITALLKMNPTKARLRQENGEYAMVEVETLKIGDQLKVLPGDQVPTDGVILEGSSTLNESSINGESMPQEKTVGAEVYGSTINGQGTFTMTVTKVASDTIFAKILTLVNQSQSRLSPTATKIKQIEPLYVKTVIAIVPLFILSGIVIFQWGWY